MLHPEEKQYLRDLAYIQAEKEMEYMNDLEEWERKEAKIMIIIAKNPTLEIEENIKNPEEL